MTNSSESNSLNNSKKIALINPLVYPLCHYIHSNFFMNYTWIDSFIYSFIPFLIILICNLALINKVINTKRNIARHTNAVKKEQISANKNIVSNSQNLEDNNLIEKTLNIASVTSDQMDRLKYMAFTVLGVTFLFIIFTMPINIYLPIMQASGKLDVEKKICNDDIIFHILNNMVNCNHSINFFIYLFTNTKFKNEIKSILDEILLFFTSRNIFEKKNSSNINNDINSRASTFTFTKNNNLTVSAVDQSKNDISKELNSIKNG